MKTRNLLAAACLTLLVTACDSNEDNPSSSNFDVYNVMTLISPADGTTPVVEEPVYKVSMNTLNEMAVSAARFDVMGRTITFDTGYGAFRYGVRAYGDLQLEAYTFSKNSLSSSTGATVKNLSMIYTNDYVVPSAYSSETGAAVDFPYGNYFFLARYDIDGVGTAQTFYKMAAFGGETRTSFPNREGVMQTYSDQNITFEYALDTKKMTADIMIFDAKFAPDPMPTIPVMRLEGLTLTYKNGAIELAGTGIIPKVLEGDGYTDYDRFQFDDITFEIKGDYLNVASAHFTVASIYAGSFEGALTPRK